MLLTPLLSSVTSIHIFGTKTPDLKGCDAVVLPGGFSYGDYLRCGAVARFSPVMESVSDFAEQGGPVIGICNGFQILTEAHLLPGALLRNSGLKFICKTVPVRVDATCDWVDASIGEVWHLPINHNEGNYVCDADVLEDMKRSGQIVLRYCAEDGSDIENAPNGALDRIAGISNKQGNVFGLMPHPERVVDPISGRTDGRKVFEAVIRRIEKSSSKVGA